MKNLIDFKGLKRMIQNSNHNSYLMVVKGLINVKIDIKNLNIITNKHKFIIKDNKESKISVNKHQVMKIIARDKYIEIYVDPFIKIYIIQKNPNIEATKK